MCAKTVAKQEKLCYNGYNISGRENNARKIFKTKLANIVAVWNDRTNSVVGREYVL